MSTTAAIDIDQFAINTAKGLIMDTVRNADSGHTGGPFSSLDYTYTLFKEFLEYLALLITDALMGIRDRDGAGQEQVTHRPGCVGLAFHVVRFHNPHDLLDAVL